MSSSGDEVRVAVFPGEPVARMWAEALRREGVPVLLKPLGPGPSEFGNPVSLPHALFVLVPEVERARALIPQEYQVWPAPEEDQEFHLGVKMLIYVVCLALMGLLLWVAFFR